MNGSLLLAKFSAQGLELRFLGRAQVELGHDLGVISALFSALALGERGSGTHGQEAQGQDSSGKEAIVSRGVLHRCLYKIDAELPKRLQSLLRFSFVA